jgi:hypothetical protein
MWSLCNVAGLPSSFLMPVIAQKVRDQRALVVVLVAVWSVAVGGIPFASEYYESDAFGISNLSLMVGHEFEFEHGGTLPVSAQVMYNPMAKGFFWGVSVGYYFSLDL